MTSYDSLLANPEEIITSIENILKEHPNGISEYEFLTELAASHPFFASQGSNAAQINLFQRHFLLFHWLYQLRECYLAEQSGLLEISALCIQLLPYEPGPHAMELDDPLKEYYMDISQLHETGEDDVDELLARFWIALSRRESRAEALAILELADPIDDKMIRQTYRRLVMQHHPDRGGDTSKIQALNQAMDQLLPRS